MEIVRASAGFFSDAGARPDNQDFAGAVFGWELEPPRREVVAVIADGIGGAKGGRVAAETAVRGFLDGFFDLPETMPVQRAGATIIAALNGWIYAQGHRDAALDQAWAPPSPPWCCAGEWRIYCMPATAAPIA